MITVNNNIYKDDFLASNVENKNYLRILFNGGRSVQVRELNQLQSILQSQIDKFGSSVYKSGVAVIGGNCTFDRTIYGITFSHTSLGYFTPSPVVPGDVQKISQNPDSAPVISADVIGYEDDANTQTVTFYIRYSTGGVFDVDAQVTLSSTLENGNGPALPSGTGLFAGAFLSEGVFFVNGSFVITPAQQIFIPVEDEINGVTGSVVLNVIERYVTYVQDQTLLDNSDGLPNHLAPGADRYQIQLNLAFVSEDESDVTNRIVLHKIVNSNVIFHLKDRFSDLDRQLAQRTYEESGNYTVNPFKIEVAELEGSGRPGSEEADANLNAYVGLDPAVAYVDGYRVDLTRRYDLVLPKARTTDEKAVDLSLNIGNFVDIVPAAGSAMPLPNSAHLTYDLISIIPVLQITAGVQYKIFTTGNTDFTLIGAANSTPGTVFTATATPPLGTGTVQQTSGSCRIKAIESIGGLFRVYLYDITLNAFTNFSDISSIENSAIGVELTTVSSLQNASEDTGVYPLPYANVRSILQNDPSDFTYIIKKLWTGTASAGGQFPITTASGETFFDTSLANAIIESNGDWIPLSGVTIVSSSSSSITFGGLSPSNSVKVLFPVRVETITPAAKELTKIENEVVSPVGNIYTLATSDIFDIVSVVDNDAPSTNLEGLVEISFDGQTPTKYTNAQLRYVGAGTAPVIRVTYRHFEHNGLPFTVNSYLINWDLNSALADDEIRYEDVPSFNGTRLSDMIDFRPLILNNPGTISAIQPDPNSVFSCAPTFFLSRYDKVLVDSLGKFFILNGTPAIKPELPLTPPSTMCLYELFVPAYTFSARDILLTMINNRRYTMRDIGHIEDKLKRLEYYTSLSLNETSLNEKSIFDANGQRFKNGILVDSFNGHAAGDVLNTAYRCSVDRSRQTLHPFFKTESVDLIVDSNINMMNNVKINEHTVTLDYDEVPAIQQLFSSESESVNPYDVASFVGSIKLYPNADRWVETSRRPNVIVNDDSAFDALQFIANETNILGTEWNAWETTWTGRTSRFISNRTPGFANIRSRTGNETTTTRNQIRDGVLTTLESSIQTQNLGDRIVDISFVPFIRSRKVYFHAVGLKPLTRVYPFFDGVNISAYCNNVASVVKPSEIETVQEYLNKTPGSTNFITNEELISNENGEILGSFIIPNNNQLKFAVGDREFRLTDSTTNNRQEETTFANGTYTASGQLQSVEATILSTRVPEFRTERVTDARVTVDVNTRWRDPLAQTFLITDVPEGIFATSIDLWFTQASTSSIPVTVRIVTVSNGYPTQTVVPFSEVTLNSSKVNIWSADPTEDQGLTKFEFSDPVYLKSGTEYAIVVISNDANYRIRVARLGGTDENGNTIQENPYGGVMFMSQNASTWTADQTRDLKFALNKAEFATDAIGTVRFRSILREGVSAITIANGGEDYVDAAVEIDPPDVIDSVQATADAIVDVSSGTVTGVVITEPGSGYTTKPTVTITSATGQNATVVDGEGEIFTAPVSAFSLMQGNLPIDNTVLRNTLTFASNQYGDIIPAVTYSPTSEFTITRLNRITLESELTTNSTNLTPVIALDGLSLLTIHNQVNNVLVSDTTEVQNDAGIALSRYMTREVELNDPADQLNIYVDVNRPIANANILLYVKVKYDSNTYSDWVLVNPTREIPISDNSEEYPEVTYSFSSPDNDFISFQTKIVFSSATTVRVATVRNLRIIATS